MKVYPGVQAQIFPTKYIHWSGATKQEVHLLGGRAPAVGFSSFLYQHSWQARWFCEGQVAGICSVRGCAGWHNEEMFPKYHRQGLFS